MDATKVKVLRLKELQARQGSTLFERCKLASEVMQDRDYIASEFGQYDKAQKALEDQFFADLKGIVTLHDLIEMYRWQPDESQWRQLRYNLPALRAEWELATRAKKEPRPMRRATLAELDELREQLNAERKRKRRESLELVHAEEKRKAEQSHVEREASLHARIRELEREVDRLNCELATLRADQQLAESEVVA